MSETSHQVHSRLQAFFASPAARRLVLSDSVDRSAEVSRATWRPVLIRQQAMWQLTRQRGTQAIHENQDAASAADLAARLLEIDFRSATMLDDAAETQITRRRGGAYLVRQKEHKTGLPVAIESHNRVKAYLIPEGTPCPFLERAGVMDAAGRVRRAMYHKFRQINRFLELVSDVVPSLSIDRPLRIIDFGCGKSYLTFALHHYFTKILGREVLLTGLDLKTDVLGDCTRIAQDLGCAGLEFREGTIATYGAEGPVDLAVSLHACDTATDEALAQAVRWKTQVILAVPCCQHELAPRIESPELAAMVRYGLLRERFAALATDTLRAQWLELAGYATQLVEFIDLEHTPKNILIRSVRRAAPRADLATIHAEFQQIKELLGISESFLEHLKNSS